MICPVVGVGGPFVGCDSVLTGDDDLLVIVISVVIGSSTELIFLSIEMQLSVSRFRKVNLQRRIDR